ncbi:MAG: GHKL domain-containing protein [[Clostridium] spiroforme]|uniref:GHKL domain-containing protein n=1 Tax=Thomasclavelia spiroformis TaxID=29348 RepID=A0A943ELJ5_9FIRM|nr:sensor histidine kinase [Thomasclavelia spiroformis]MBS5588616.1 GHKL domain-containing protein [Thomasclavelia spiroformis]
MIINFLESLIASYFFTNYFDLKINKYVYFIINFVFISSEINIFSYFYDFSVILPLLVVLTATVIAKIYTKNIFWEILFITFFDELIVGWSIILSLFLEDYVGAQIRTIIAKFLYFIIIYFTIKTYKNMKLKINALYWKLLAVVIVVFYFAYTILVQFYLGMELNRVLIFITLLSLGLSVIGIAVIVYYISKLEQENQETQFSLQKLKMEQSNYVQLNEVAKEIKIIRHDLKHDYLLIGSYLDNKNYAKINEIVKLRVKDLHDKVNTINSANELINTIINYKLMIAASKNIEVNCNLNVSNKIYMKDYHLNELLSNLIDNAIENCSKNNRKISIIINEDVFLYIEVINSIDVSVLNSNPNLLTNKKGDIHGHGIKSVKRIVNEYNGNIKFFENALEFHVSIIIPLNYPH